MGNENVTAAPSGAFRTGDGLLNIAANKQEQFVSLCGVIGRQELLDDPRFAMPDARMANRYLLRDLWSREGLASASAAEWEIRLNRVGVPAGRVLTVPQGARRAAGHGARYGGYVRQRRRGRPLDCRRARRISGRRAGTAADIAAAGAGRAQ